MVTYYAKQATMSFSTKVIPPVCWIILYLQYLIVNEGGPELPCMTGVVIIIIIIIIIIRKGNVCVLI